MMTYHIRTCYSLADWVKLSDLKNMHSLADFWKISNKPYLCLMLGGCHPNLGFYVVSMGSLCFHKLITPMCNCFSKNGQTRLLLKNWSNKMFAHSEQPRKYKVGL